MSRNEFTVTLSWLKDFQADFVAALDTSFMTQSYDIDEITAGIEALINVATGTPELLTVHQTEITYFQVNTSDAAQAIRDVYYNAYDAYHDHWLSTDTSETYPVVMDIHIDSVKDNTAYIKATTIVGVNNAGLETEYTFASSNSCEPYEDGDGFRVGGGDEELSLANTYWNPACPNACGDTPSNESGPTAYEEIEARINFNYLANNQPCPSNYVFRSWANVKKVSIYLPDYLEQECPFILGHAIGTCMDYLKLNCVFCYIYNQIGEAPFEIPSGLHFVSINLGLSVCACGSNGECNYIAVPQAEYYVGTPVCKLASTSPTPWRNPKSFNLDDVSF